MMDRYFPGLLSVAFANRSPAETVDEIEGNKPGRDCPAPPAYPPSPVMASPPRRMRRTSFAMGGRSHEPEEGSRIAAVYGSEWAPRRAREKSKWPNRQGGPI
jgi:hypothetical protein